MATFDEWRRPRKMDGAIGSESDIPFQRARAAFAVPEDMMRAKHASPFVLMDTKGRYLSMRDSSAAFVRRRRENSGGGSSDGTQGVFQVRMISLGQRA